MNIKTTIIALVALFGLVQAQTSSMSVMLDLWRERNNYLSSLSFWRNVLLYMQDDDGNVTSQCITTFDEFIVLQNGIASKLATDVDYYAGLASKGQGNGS